MHSPPSRRRVLLVALAVPAVAIGIGVIPGPRNLAAATALCLLAVVVAAALAGRASGMIAAVVSFFGLNFFFTEPRHTFQVHGAGDLIALFAFLLSAIVVGELLTKVQQERALAERRATEAQLLSRTTAKLMSGKPFSQILEDLAAALVEIFELAQCEISAPNATGAASGDRAGRVGRSVTLPLATQSGTFGSLTAVRRLGAQDFTVGELQLLETLASQTALSIERAVLDERVREAHLDAEASKMRAALFSSVTHDLRTPLSSIKASASGLLATGAQYTDLQREEMARTMLEEADHLNQILSNLLDLARMRAGALTPSKQPIFAEEIIGSVLWRMRRTLETVQLRTNLRDDLPPIDADPTQIGQVFSNVLENAIRFSPNGGEIHITAARWQDTVQVRVTDHGPGIPAEDRVRVFEEFYRRDAGPGRGGTGLGLAIARAIVIAHGGNIRAESAPGGGAAIMFELPISRDRPRAADTTSQQESVAQ